MNNIKIAVIGLGYVGLPLAVAFARKYKVVGFDINEERVSQLNNGSDRTKEVERDELSEALSSGLTISHDVEAISDSNFYIVTVPTPVTHFKTPDLVPLLNASASIGKRLKKGDIVVYESTVYPGCTEEDCVPVLERESGLTYNQDFFCGYSPERINPGDKKNKLTNIVKVVSGSTPEAAHTIEQVYHSIITAGTHKTSSIKVAEACKAIENAQRDVNISFVNELALIFDRMNIDTKEVLEAAATKWNFLKFTPGLVGGHCIGVDPYYLLYKSQCLGYNPQVILSGRTINNEMGRFVASKTVKLMIKNGIKIVGSKVLILGFTFKENCPDTRNTKVVDVIDELQDFGVEVDIYDPHALRDEVKAEYGITLLPEQPDLTKYNGIILTVAHKEFREIDFTFVQNQSTVLFDVKSMIDQKLTHGRL
ncbi:nucleotide sugar dehydrogenase [Massilibacteroides vaginae]|uniref:nucleotide sugar dehydrogenase n=1 Tax=Massilibacteroides vaginae TaxID=1673718 RepID=UPI000A1C8FB7|nr:nucleotide sugar dehydrogenase [Massilibacteroides vaginae]